ncbi:MAG: RidA family protein [Bdellovibrionales bacterium]|nr:RidA family protein [Bdellovibrionales bacterium]
MKKIISTDSAPKAIGPYSQAVLMDSFLFCSGQIPIDPKTNEVFTGDIKTQTEMVIKNIEGVLKAADMNFSNVVKTTIFLTNMSDFATVNEIYGKSFATNPPARSTVAVAALPKGVNVEIEVLAHR